MRYCAIFFASLLLAFVFPAPSAYSKEGVKATVHTPISTSAYAGTEIHVMWSLADEKTGRPFNACAVFIRLVSPTGEATEAFAECGLEASEGKYDANPVVPVGGILRIEIGVAGTMTDREGKSRRSDWLMPLTNDPFGN
jgi:hypothetical protein